MASERVVHNRLEASVYIALRETLAKAEVAGEVFTDGLTVPIEPFTAYAPDATVVLGEPLPGTARHGTAMKITDRSSSSR